MKKNLIVFSKLLLLVAIFFASCVHEIPHDFCSTDPISLTYTKTDATGTLNNGAILCSATGGTDIKYSLNSGLFTSIGSFTGLMPNTSYVLVSKNSWGCTDTAHIQIGLITPPNPCAGVTITVNASKTDASPSQSNGTITASASPIGTYTYSLNNGTFQPSGNFTGLAAGNYTVIAKNSSGCTGTNVVSVGTIDPCAGVTVMVSSTKVDPTTGQSNGSITATATGGTGFSYSLNNGTYQSSGTFTGLVTGNYTITAKNSNGCSGVTTVILGSTNPCAGVTITVNSTKTDPSISQSNGSITATAIGGSGFTYSLNGGTFQASGVFTGLAAGTYTITAKSSLGCIGSSVVTLTATNPCTSIFMTINNGIANVVPCSSPAANGSITVTAGGSSGYTYNINGGSFQSSNIFSSLAAGNFTIGVKDINGCTKTAPSTVGTANKGPQFTDVRNLITSRCSGSNCHMNGSSAAGYNFDSDCNIISYWSQINRSTVLYTMIKMPKSPQAFFSAAEKLIITNWVNAGHGYSN